MSHTINANHTISSHLDCLECLNSIHKISGVHRAVDTSRVVVQATTNPLGNADLKVCKDVSLIV